ncbi:MAG: hypothetical protein JST01_22340 [Cyanobacteria bacterium SZAS TMP-1]|nr:hypothetical protein [Cyanobacteria bacterium SZAS TMP-1]
MPKISTNEANSQNLTKLPLAEVLTSSITGLTAETLPEKLNQGQPAARPKFGSFVKVASPENGIDIFAVVFDVVTNPPDSVHKPSALGMSRDRLRLEQPHIFALLKTHMQAAIIGYRDIAEKPGAGEEGAIFQHLPPQPPDVHDFVYEASRQEVISLTSNFEFLRLLAHINSVPTDELIAAAIRRSATARVDGGADIYLIEAGRAIAQLFRSDYDRMVSIVKKIRPPV